MAKNSKSSALLSLLQNAPTEPTSIPEGRTDVVKPTDVPRQRPGTERSSATGKRTQVFLHDADRRIIRELVAYFAGQGRRVSESLVIKAALRAAKPGEALLNAYEEAAHQDQRFKERRTA